MRSGVLELFRELTSVPTAPFFEASVSAKALSWIKKNLGRKVTVARRRGGIIVRYQGHGSGPALCLAAHLDHPAFRLSHVTARGALGKKEGGLPAHLLIGNKVEAFAARPKDNRPLATGVLSKEIKEGFYDIVWEAAPSRGERPAFATLALTPFAIAGRWLLSRSIDDLLGCAISLEVLRKVSAAKLKTNVTVLLHRAEEVGFMGALDLISEGAVDVADSVLSIETSRELPGARPGRGPVIRLGDKACLFDGNLTALLDSAAAKMKRVQRLRLTGGTCEATAYQAFGYESAGVAIPLVNYHNGWGAKAVAPEKVRVEDVAGSIRLLVEAARLFGKPNALRGALRRRLSDRHAALRRFL
ncbi:MAG: M20/M25/M40 family metallo-hydrolase [Elusimicrobia bacterium]|nr:M20/M25/M40 family metallo-hydrolase [Elusimicrobiota bacterium]